MKNGEKKEYIQSQDSQECIESVAHCITYFKGRCGRSWRCEVGYDNLLEEIEEKMLRIRR